VGRDLNTGKCGSPPGLRSVVNQARNKGVQGLRPPAKFFSPLGKMCGAYFETTGHRLNNLDPLRKLFACPSVPSCYGSVENSCSKQNEECLPLTNGEVAVVCRVLWCSPGGGFVVTGTEGTWGGGLSV